MGKRVSKKVKPKTKVESLAKVTKKVSAKPKKGVTKKTTAKKTTAKPIKATKKTYATLNKVIAKNTATKKKRSAKPTEFIRLSENDKNEKFVAIGKRVAASEVTWARWEVIDGIGYHVYKKK